MKSIDENAVATLCTSLRILQIKSSKRVIRETLMLHPNFPSLLSLSDVMLEWNIKNIGLQLDSSEQLRDLPTPFIAHIHKEGGRYIIVTNIKDDTITYIDSREGKLTEKLSFFGQDWSGTVLLIEYIDGESRSVLSLLYWNKWVDKLNTSSVMMVLILCLIWVILCATHNTDNKNWLLSIIKSIGFLISVLLLYIQLNNEKQKEFWFCGISCNKVLGSPAARIMGYLSWSEMSFVYFSGSILTSKLLYIYKPELLSVLIWFSVLGCFYVPFSIYYQRFVIRQWCFLCLCAQVVLLLDGFLSIKRLSCIPNYTPLYILFFIGFSISMLMLFLIKKITKYVIKNEKNYYELMQLKRNPELFEVMLIKQKKMPLVGEDMWPLVLGRVNSEHTITVVTNLYCGPCATVHRELEKLIERSNNIKVEIIFTTDDDIVTQAVLHLLAIADKDIAVDALSSWYRQEKKDFNIWSAKYAHCYYSTTSYDVVIRHRKWCRAAGIQFTPTIFVDGYQLPKQYQLSDIKWLINCLPVQE